MTFREQNIILATCTIGVTIVFGIAWAIFTLLKFLFS